MTKDKLKEIEDRWEKADKKLKYSKDDAYANMCPKCGKFGFQHDARASGEVMDIYVCLWKACEYHKAVELQPSKISSHADTRTLLDMLKEWEELDDCVLAFAKQMQFELDKNKHKECPTMNPKGEGRGWSHCHFTWLHGRIKDELKELWGSLKNRLADPESVLNECADVGNFAMMIHDKTLKENTNESRD